ncbi:MAG: hypothetical protein AABX11_05845 [Nanoarchaeota archaeon]
MSLAKVVLTVKENPEKHELGLKYRDVRDIPYEELTKAVTRLSVSWHENQVHADIGRIRTLIYSMAGGNVIYNGEEMSNNQTLTFLNEDKSKIHYMGYLLGLEDFLEKPPVQ